MTARRAAISEDGGPALIRARAAAMRDVVPDWLAEVVRPRPAPVPWPAMLRAALAICVPLAVTFPLGKGTLGVLPAIGGLLGTVVDAGGSYLHRVRRVGTAAVGGSAAGLMIGSVIHGHGWLAVAALVVIAGVSGMVSGLGDVGSVTGLQLLVYVSLGIGPIGAQRPAWHTVAGFLAGVAWALVLILPGWLVSPYGREQRAVATVYQALADKLGAAGGNDFTGRRQAVTAALNAAYDVLLVARSMSPGRNRRITRLMAALNAANLIAEAATALGLAGVRPPPLVISTVARFADSVRDGSAPPPVPPAWDDSRGALALRDAMAAAARALSGDWSPAGLWGTGGTAVPGRRGARRRGIAQRAEALGGGRLGRLFTVRLMACMGAAGAVTEVAPLARSYWVPLTVAIVFKPDLGSVFARALQRGIGTVLGAVAGALLLIPGHGTWLLIPLAVLAALLPYARSRNYGLFATVLTPLVVILIDLLSPAGWRLAADRLTDTVIGCAIVLLIGFAPWPMSWYAHLPGQFARAALDVSGYLVAALAAPGDPATRSRMRRQTYRDLADLRAEFQRTMSEPPAVSRRASAWWPAVVALEQVMDAITAVAVSAADGEPAPPAGVAELAASLRAVSEAAAAGIPVAVPPELPADPALQPVTEAVRALLGVLRCGERGAGRG
jgi:uncharacterized membrane protein YccC